VTLRVVLLCLLAGFLAGCGGSDGGDRTAAGKQVFLDAGCGECHSLAAARSSGAIGPDLDQVRPSEDRVAAQVERGGGAMPAFRGRLSREEIAAVASFVAASTRTSTVGASIAADYEPDDTELSDCTDDWNCYEQAFANLAYRQGPQSALRTFERRIESPGPVESNCHRIVHAIGAGALAHFDDDPGRALAQGSVACGSGYYHGILERSLLGKSDGEVRAATRSICSAPEIRKTEFIHFQCVHGLGHGLMIYTGYDLPRSLTDCELLRTQWEKESCRGGVFMENSQSSYGVRSKWLKEDDVLYPCNAVARRYKYQCYLIQLAHIAPALNYDWRKIAAACRRSEKPYIAVCFESVGREISGFTRHDVRRELRFCRLAGDMEDQCLYGAARTTTYDDAGPRRSRLLCAAAPARVRSTCWRGVGTILGSLNTYAEQRKAACRRATGSDQRAYYRDCLEGANVSGA
jgi:cytochrome c553